MQTFINVIKTFAGAGTFGLPWAFKQSGILAGTIALLLMALLANYTMNLLVKCRRFIQAQEQYSDTSDYWRTRVLRQKIRVRDVGEIEKLRNETEAKDEWEEEERKRGVFYKKPKRKKPLHWRLKFEGVPDEVDEAREMLRGKFADSGADISVSSSSASLSALPLLLPSPSPSPSPLPATTTTTPSLSSPSPSPSPSTQQTAITVVEKDPNDYIYDQYRIFTYMDLGYEAMGNVGSALVYCLLFMCNLGVCTVYLTMIAELMHSMVPQISHHLWLVFTIPLFVPMSWIRSYAFITPISILGTASLLIALMSVLIYGVTERMSFMKAPWHYPFQFSVFNPHYFTRFIGIVLFLFNTHTSVLPMEQATSPRRKYGMTLRFGFVFIVIINLSFALLVLMFFGTGIEANAMNNLPGGTVWVYIIKGFLVAEVVFTYAVVLMPVSEAFDEKVIYKLKNRYWAFIVSGSVIRTLLVLFTVGVAAIFGNNFGVAMSFIGGLGPNLLGFGLPSLFYLIIMRRHYGFITFMFNCFIIVFGLFALMYNTYMTYVDLRYPE